MKVGDYVRTPFGITRIKENVHLLDAVIKETDSDIKDLIEYGDIVKYKIDNEEFISEVWGDKNNYFVQNFDVPIDLIDLDIISIITHEQIKQMEYRIGE